MGGIYDRQHQGSVERHRLPDVVSAAADVARAPQNLVLALPVGAVRSLGVRDDPWPTGIPDENHPRNTAHALIKGLDGLSTSERRRWPKALAELPSLELIYP